MATYCVYHVIHVRTPYQYIPKLLIRRVPENMVLTEELIERAGYQFSEFNIPWGNHVLAEVNAKSSPSDLVARIREGDFTQIDYDYLVEQAESPL